MAAVLQTNHRRVMRHLEMNYTGTIGFGSLHSPPELRLSAKAEDSPRPYFAPCAERSRPPI